VVNVLACCHGNDPAEGANPAALLHRAGMRSVLAYRGPISDALSTAAEANG
jgi:hypothetical protein